MTLLRALKTLFAALNTARERGASSAAELQEAIAALDAGSGGGFSLGDRHDATELLEFILAALDYDYAITGHGAHAIIDGPPGTTQPRGPVATMLSTDMRLERERENGGPLRFTQWTLYLVDRRLREMVHELTTQTQLRMREREQRALVATLTEWRDGDAQPTRMERAPRLRPRVLILVLATDNTALTRDERATTFAGIPVYLNLTEAFGELGDAAPYELRAITTFYGAHWVCYRWRAASRSWWKYDDASIVAEVGSRLDDVKAHCRAMCRRACARLSGRRARPCGG